jgi:ABC-type phosphate transport system ATPase subunit
MFMALRHDIHDLDQVSRICRASHENTFMLMGKVVERAATADMFVTPAKQETADYIEGRYG